MNEILKSLSERKSLRVFKDRAIPKDVKEEILNAAINAPTAGNMTLYTVLDITDQALKEKLSVTCDNQPFIAKAPLVLIFCADYFKWYNTFSKYSQNVRTPQAGDLLLANSDALIAAQNAVIAAESYSLGSCYIGDILENFEEHQSLLKLPKYVVPACMVVFGYPAESQKSRKKPPRFPLSEVVFENTYNVEKAEAFDKALMTRQDLSSEEFELWIQKFCDRKYMSDFSLEMSRSAGEIIKEFSKEDDTDERKRIHER